MNRVREKVWERGSERRRMRELERVYDRKDKRWEEKMRGKV